MKLNNTNIYLTRQSNVLFFVLFFCIQGCSSLPSNTNIVKIKSGEIAVSIKGVGSPTVVFESGMGTNKETWNSVFYEMSKTNKVFSYDRHGLGESSKSRTTRDPCTIAKELHAALKASNTKPPYILVGHSSGGLYQYVFAKYYPNEVVGLTLVDSHLPEPWIHQKKIPLPKEYLSKNKPNYFMRLREKLLTKYTTGGKEGANMYNCLENIDITEPVKFPVRIIQAVDSKNMPEPLINWFKKRVKWYFQEWFHILGKKVPTREVNSGHYIQEERPDVVVQEIQKLIKNNK